MNQNLLSKDVDKEVCVIVPIELNEMLSIVHLPCGCERCRRKPMTFLWSTCGARDYHCNEVNGESIRQFTISQLDRVHFLITYA
jgi:hypothetical protein